jgi:hypothetical protein
LLYHEENPEYSAVPPIVRLTALLAAHQGAETGHQVVTEVAALHGAAITKAGGKRYGNAAENFGA